MTYKPDTIVAVMTGVREYAEGYDVELVRDGDTGRLAVRAFNEGRFNNTCIDVEDLVRWLYANEPNLLVLT